MDGQNEIKEIDRLILKYLEGEASKDEKIALYRWIELSEENKTHFKEAQELWLSTQAILAPKEDTEKALQRFRSKIKNYNRRGKTFRKPLYYITQCAAIIVILLGLYYFFTRESNSEQYACVEMAIGNKDSSLYHIWAQEKLLLSNCELTEVIEKLGAWYNVTMTCTNTSPAPVYMTLTVRTEPLKEILQTLKSIAPIDYRFNNDTVYIEHKPNS